MVPSKTGGAERTGYALPDAARLFRRRLLDHWREQYRNVRTVVDWIVMLYIIIPGLLLGARYYYGFWNGELPAWVSALPFGWLPILFAVLLVTGGMLLLLQDGDLLFLRQRQTWIRGIMLRGICYSLAVTALKICTVYLLLLPFIVRGYGIGIAAAGWLLVLTVSCGWCIKLLAHLVKVQHQGFRRWLRLIPAVTVPCALYIRAAIFWDHQPWALGAAAGVYAAGTAWAVWRRLRLQGTFLGDVREDFKQRMRIASWMLSSAVDKPRPTRHKPWIFRRSQPLLSSRQPESRYAAAGIKALVRNPGHVKLYLQFTGVSLAAVLLVPAFLKWLMYLLLTVLMAYWLSSFWQKFSGDDFIGILPFTKAQKADAGAKALQLMILPFALLCVAAVCVPAYGWWGVLFFIPVGAAAGSLAVKVFSVFRFQR